jgi:phage terminase large subunit-like protein
MPFKVLTLTAEAEANDILGRQPGESLDEERLPAGRRDELKRSDPVIWNALYQQKNVTYGGAFFAKENLHFYKQVDPELLNRYMAVDPANSKKKTSDFTTIYVFGVGEDHNYYWLHMLRDRLSPDERSLSVVRLHRRYKPLVVGYEEYGMQTDIFNLQKTQEKLHYRFVVTPLGLKGGHSKLSKQDRIRTLVPLFNGGQIWLPEHQVTTLVDGTEQDMIPLFIEKEYLKYPSVTHEDMLDVMSRQTDPVMGVEFPINQDDFKPSQAASSGRTWVSG